MHLELLDNYGINYRDGLIRCLNNEKLYVRMLSLFLKDPAFPEAELAWNDRDYSALYRKMHELKGTSGNLGMTELFHAVSTLVEMLRGENPDETVVAVQFGKVKAIYTTACTGAKMVLSQGETN